MRMRIDDAPLGSLSSELIDTRHEPHLERMINEQVKGLDLSFCYIDDMPQATEVYTYMYGLLHML
jgi:hypothetical protein